VADLAFYFQQLVSQKVTKRAIPKLNPPKLLGFNAFARLVHISRHKRSAGDRKMSKSNLKLGVSKERDRRYDGGRRIGGSTTLTNGAGDQVRTGYPQLGRLML